VKPLQTLRVPTTSITEVKKSPSNIFNLAESSQNAVYVFNRGAVSGVMMTRLQYEDMAARLEELEEEVLDYRAALRLQDSDVTTYTDTEVRAPQRVATLHFDDGDGWE
jgi:PHD/YefM family antitoxin component YafN of YafNO toxin-antitoxin module